MKTGLSRLGYQALAERFGRVLSLEATAVLSIIRASRKVTTIRLQIEIDVQCAG